MWGLYSWRDLNIYLILFLASIKNKNQSYSKEWRWWVSAFKWELVNIFFYPRQPIPKKNVAREKYLSEIEFRQVHNYVLFNCDELRHFI
jgi:hypothetical protein